LFLGSQAGGLSTKYHQKIGKINRGHDASGPQSKPLTRYSAITGLRKASWSAPVFWRFQAYSQKTSGNTLNSPLRNNSSVGDEVTSL
jgi:hypothetical protein